MERRLIVAFVVEDRLAAGSRYEIFEGLIHQGYVTIVAFKQYYCGTHNECFGNYMKGISINGRKLHEIMMPLVPYENCNSVVSQRYPKQRIEFELYDHLLKLTVPSKLALEMYRVGILPQDESLDFPVSVSGKSIGNYKVVKFLYPNSIAHDDIVFITLHKQLKC